MFRLEFRGVRDGNGLKNVRRPAVIDTGSPFAARSSSAIAPGG
jgi:hypothetical protein